MLDYDGASRGHPPPNTVLLSPPYLPTRCIARSLYPPIQLVFLVFVSFLKSEELIRYSNYTDVKMPHMALRACMSTAICASNE